VFISEELEAAIASNPKFKRWIDEMAQVLKGDMCAGEQVQKRLIAPKYRRLGVNNLYRYRHPEGYRSCYTITTREGLGPCPTIIDILSHPEYDKVFGY
jgi:hypothetical protein